MILRTTSVQSALDRKMNVIANKAKMKLVLRRILQTNKMLMTTYVKKNL